MVDTDMTIDGTTTSARRLRPNTVEEQAEMMRLGRHLIAASVPREELREHLGYSSIDELDVALATGRASTIRLERLREFADARLPDMLVSKSETVANINAQRADLLAERFRQHAELAYEEQQQPRPATHFSRKGMKRERRKDYLTPKQQDRLRSQIEHLWAVDKRFKNWSLLAHISGLSSGPAIKRAYEVGSSAATLKRIDNFVRIYQAFGGRALQAAKQGIETDELQKYLMSTTPASAVASMEPTMTGTSSSVRNVTSSLPDPKSMAQSPLDALNALPATPPSIDFANLLAVAATVDTEVKRLWLTTEFFDNLANEPSMPSIIRQNASGAASRIREALHYFAPAEIAKPPQV